MALGGGVAGVARVVVEADTRRAQAGLKGLERDVQGFATRSRGALASFAKGLAVGGIAAGVYTLTRSFGAAFQEMQEGQRVAAQTEAVLKSTGGVAGVTAREIDTLADSLLRKTGIDDEAIKSGANLLLTFTNIRNVAGEGNDIFNQATRTILDMSTALGTDANTAAIQLGKALQDPIRGVTALRRVGVALTEAQRDQIKAMVESGNVIGAQKIILRELRTEFGGSAEAAGKTLPGQLNILRETLRNTGAEILTGLAPAITRLAQRMLRWTDELRANKKLQQDVKNTIGDVVDTTRDMIHTADDIADALGGWKQSAQFIITGALANKVIGLAGAFTKLAGAQAVAGATGAAAGGTGIAGAAGASARLLTTLQKIAKIGTIVVLIDLAISGRGQRALDWIDERLRGTGIQLPFTPGGVGGPGGLSGPPRNLGKGGKAASGGIQIPTSHRSTHPTSGLGGYPAVDYFAKPGTPVLAPENGAVVRHSGRGGTSGGVYGWSLYYDGYETGNSYYITHLSWVAPLGKYRKGQMIGRVSAWTGGDPHAHVGIRPGGAGQQRGGPDLSGAAPPTADPGRGKKKPKKSGGVIPAALELDLAEAELTKGTTDDIRALRAIEAYLEKRLKSERNVNERIRILRELKQVRSQLESVGGGRARKGLEDLIPDILENKLARAELTKTLEDDLKVLREIEAYLEKRLAGTKKFSAAATRIMRELKDVRAQIEGIMGAIGADKKAIDKLIGDVISGTNQILEGPRDRSPVMFVPGTNYQERITTDEGRAELTKILASLEPQKQRIRDWAREVDNKRKAARERVATLRKQLAKLDRTPARLRTAAWRQARANLVAAIKELTEVIAQLDTAFGRALEMWQEIEATEMSETQRIAGEDEDRRSSPPTDSGGAGFGGGGGGDDDAGSTTSGPSAADIEAQVQAEVARNTSGLLTARSRFLSDFASNVFSPGPFGFEFGSTAPLSQGTNITVNMLTPPPEPFAWLKSLHFQAFR